MNPSHSSSTLFPRFCHHCSCSLLALAPLHLKSLCRITARLHPPVADGFEFITENTVERGTAVEFANLNSQLVKV